MGVYGALPPEKDMRWNSQQTWCKFELLVNGNKSIKIRSKFTSICQIGSQIEYISVKNHIETFSSIYNYT